MSAIADLLSTLVFFLAWLFPVLIIIVTRRRVQEQKKKKATSAEKPLDEKDASRKPKRFPGRPDELVNRLMDIQGMRQLDAVADHEPELEIKPAPKYREVPKMNKRIAPAVSITPGMPKREKPLAVLEKYPLNKRAIVLAELIGKPKALDRYP